MKLFNTKLFLTVAVAATMAVGANAADTTAASPAFGLLSTVSSAELPAKAADLVAQAKAKNLKQTTIDVVKAAVGLNPAAAPAIVGSIAQSSPTMAATASATAVALVPDQVLLIAKAAAAAAPTKAGEIVKAICVVLPSDYKITAQAVADVVPGAGREILKGVATAIPQLTAAIDQTLAGYQGDIPSVGTVLTQLPQITSLPTGVAVAGATPAGLPQGPSVGAPPVSPSGTPTIISPGAGGVIPSGAPRGYNAP